MRLLLLLILASTTALFADDFRVEKLEIADRILIKAAKRDTDAAMEEVRKAQAILDRAKAEESAVRDRILKRMGIHEYDQCRSGETAPSNGVVAVVTGGFREIEIRGDYVLVTEGTKSCWSSWYGSGTSGPFTLEK